MSQIGCCTCRWLKVVLMVMNMMEWYSLNWYGELLFCQNRMPFWKVRFLLQVLFLCFLEFDRSCWIWEFKNWDNWTKEKRRILHKQKPSNSGNCRLFVLCFNEVSHNGLIMFDDKLSTLEERVKKSCLDCHPSNHLSNFS